jgi:DNA-binding NtrC family response regulator/Tfp pilus assembly protein PilZ
MKNDIVHPIDAAQLGAQMVKKERERRGSPRGRVLLCAGIFAPKKILIKQKLQISEQGTFLQTNTYCKVGQEVIVPITDVNGERLMSLKARVARVMNGRGKWKYGVGVKFIDVPNRERGIIREMVRTSRFTLPRVIVLCDNDDLFRLMSSRLTEDRYDIVRIKTVQELSKEAGEESPTVVVADIEVSDKSLQELRHAAGDAAVVVISSDVSHEMKSRAGVLKIYEFVGKPLDPDAFIKAVGQAIEAFRKEHENASTGAEIRVKRKGKAEKTRLPRFVARSGGMVNIWRNANRIAPTEDLILLSGETGTGKEVLANWIHVLSGRVKRPFMVADLSTVTASLMDSELFGHMKGSFTGANKDHVGLVEKAGDGTLFIDEISVLTLDLQPKLLRILEKMEFRSVGGTDMITVKSRIIVATNKDLDRMVKEGEFREDLRNRLNVHKIEIPPLRKRSEEDRHELALAIIDEYNPQYKTSVNRLGPEAYTQLMTHSWPENVRGLVNAVRRSLTNAESDTLKRFDLNNDESTTHTEEVGSLNAELLDFSKPWPENRKVVVSSFKKAYCQEIYRRYECRVAAAAKHAGVTRQYLNRIIKQYGLKVSYEKKLLGKL